MSSVTQRIAEIKQPYGGFVRPKNFIKATFDDGIELYGEENIHPSLVGLAVDYLTRFMMGANKENAFIISLLGAATISKDNDAKVFLDHITGLDDNSIINACKLVGYDVCYRVGVISYKPVELIEPNEETIFNIRTMVERSLLFWDKHGPIVKDGFTFEGGYTDIIDSGDGDYLTEDTLWDFKVIKNKITSKNTLQLLIYYLMGKHSIHEEFKSIKQLGIYNPRQNIAYTINVSEIEDQILNEVEVEVIGYEGDINREEKTLWTLNDLQKRYGVSSRKITKDFFYYGLPYMKEGRRYVFDRDEVIAWELYQRWVPYGRGDSLELPAYTAYGILLEAALKEARKNKNKEEIKRIKEEQKLFGYKRKLNISGFFDRHKILIMWIAIIIFMLCFLCARRTY